MALCSVIGNLIKPFRFDKSTFFRLLVLSGLMLSVYIFLSFNVKTSIGYFYSKSLLDSRTGAKSTLRQFTSTPVAPTILQINASKPIQKYGKYFVVPNYVLAKRTYKRNESVTLTTQGSAAFLNNVEPLCRRWGGPVSLTVYAGSDLEVNRALRIISHLRKCGHACILENVTWHLILELDAKWPALTDIETNSVVNENNIIEISIFPWSDPVNYNCQQTNTSKLFENALKEDKPRKLGRGYPINVARNVARYLATTFYVLASDIELYPSVNIIPRFLKMVASENPETNAGPHVYALPIFEVEKEEAAPEDKATLVKLLEKKRAVFFHKFFCDSCQNFPNRGKWPSNFPSNDSLGIHSRGKRYRSIWEPIYIGTHEDPYYDEQMTWEGYKDKMSQMFELCLLDYSIYVLDNAFLVHTPGIKRRNSKPAKHRGPFTRQNGAIYGQSIKKLKENYSKSRTKC